MRSKLQYLLRPIRVLRHCASKPVTVPQRTVVTTASRDEHVLESHYPLTPLPSGGTAQYLLDKCSGYSQRTALVDGGTGENISFGQMVDNLHRWAAVVQKRTKPGCSPPTVAMYMYNSIDYPSIFVGTMSVGAVVTTLNPAYTSEEVARQLEDSGAELLVVDPDGEKTALKAIHRLRESKKENETVIIPELFVIGTSSTGISNLKSLLEDKSAPFATNVEVPSESIAMLPYSSGTTGRPKGVCVKHGAITASLEMFGTNEFLRKPDADSPDIVVGILPFFHIYGILAIMLQSISRGDKIVSMKKFQKNEFAKAIRKYKPTLLPTVPPMLKFLIESKDITGDDLKYCHTVGCGAAPVSKSSVQKFQAKTGGNIGFVEGYGMTEILITHATPRTDPKIGYCGKLVPHTKAKVIDVNTGDSLPPGKKGELLIKTPCMMAGYHNNPEATRETIDEEGWLHTGDIAIYTEDGFFSIVDRIKELIKVKGLQVSPSELEDVLLKHPGVADVGVVGVPHDRYGEVPRAYVVKSSRQDVSSSEIHEYMEEQLSAHKQLLGGVTFIAELPKNPTGKLLRRVLKQLAEKEDE